ncbi:MULTISPECIES: MBL fold metallo-hydrolase [unclassified Luteococcus]|uniref:MBL fold metallo-hydrolase n=1 Tax=unclassified Luteococcus TaxID=2639923 RepID=UPI00313CD9BF
MQITHCGHSAVLVETAAVRVLIDPGNFSDAWHGLTDLDAILVTHLHPDHADPEHLPVLVSANPTAKVLTEPGVLETVDLAGRGEGINADSSVQLGALTVSAVGGTHAVIHRDIPMIGNVGLVLEAEGEPTFFHPGDSLATVPAGIDVLAIPAYGPWAAMKETVDFVRDVDATQGFLIHDGLLNERGWNLSFNRLGEMGNTTITDHRDRQPWTV